MRSSVEPNGDRWLEQSKRPANGVATDLHPASYAFWLGRPDLQLGRRSLSSSEDARLELSQAHSKCESKLGALDAVCLALPKQAIGM